MQLTTKWCTNFILAYKLYMHAQISTHSSESEKVKFDEYEKLILFVILSNDKFQPVPMLLFHSVIKLFTL